MGFLNQSIAQMRDLFASMTPAARITAALLLGVIGVSLGYLFQGYAGGSKEYLLNGETLTPREADRMEAAIAQAGLSDYERQGNRILVPRGQKAAYLAAVADAGALPANLDTLLLDESADIGMFVDRNTREARMKAAREQLLSMIIRKMDGVEDANVMYDIREPKGFEKRLITATVSVRPAAGEALTPRRAKMIRAAVAGADRGARSARTWPFLISRTARSSNVASDVSAESFDDPYFQTRTPYEQQMKASIEDLLRQIPGVRVQVTAELDDTLSAESRSITAQGETQTIRDRGEDSDTTDRPGRRPRASRRRCEWPNAYAAGRSGRHERHARSRLTLARHRQLRSDQRRNLAARGVGAQARAGGDCHPAATSWSACGASAIRMPRRRTGRCSKTLDQIEGEYEDNIKKMVALLLPSEPTEDKFSKVEVTVFQSLTPPPVDRAVDHEQRRCCGRAATRAR